MVALQTNMINTKPIQTIVLSRDNYALEQAIIGELLHLGHGVKVLSDMDKQRTGFVAVEHINTAINRSENFSQHLKDVHTIISTLGFSQKNKSIFDTVMDCKAVLNVLRQGKQAGIKKFIYIAPTNILSSTNTEFEKCQKEFEAEIKASGVPYVILRVNGIFQDFQDLLSQAYKGKIVLTGKGKERLCPIHITDLAKACVATLDSNNIELTIGGPEILNLKKIAEMAFEAHQKPVNIIYLPEQLSPFMLWTLSTSKLNLSFNMELNTMAETKVSVQYGSFLLEKFFEQQVNLVKKAASIF